MMGVSFALVLALGWPGSGSQMGGDLRSGGTDQGSAQRSRTESTSSREEREPKVKPRERGAGHISDANHVFHTDSVVTVSTAEQDSEPAQADSTRAASPWQSATEPADGPQVEAQGPAAVLRPPGFPEPTQPKDPEAEEEESPPWYKQLNISAFADAYAGLNYNFPEPQTGSNVFRAFDVTNGFALSWAGVDASIDGEVFGATVGLRVGPTARHYNGGDADIGLEWLKQTYVTWKPKRAGGKLSFDIGKFDTLYGAEVADSQLNFNYTRGLLNWLGQPFFHTGLRASYQFVDAFGMTLIGVNGWNNSIDNNGGKSLGLQFSLTPSDKFSLYLGYIGGPENDGRITVTCTAGQAYDADTRSCITSTGSAGESVDNVSPYQIGRHWRHFADLVVSINPTEKFSLIGNFDLGIDDVVLGDGSYEKQLWWGAMLAGRIAPVPIFAAALRGEIYQDRDGWSTGVTDLWLASGTLTLEFFPASQISIKLDTRVDAAAHADDSDLAKLFPTGGSGDARAVQFTNTLGVVVMTR